MQLTLLELIQDMLAAIDAEAVTSVDETPEAGMCINIANRAYEEMMSMFRWRHLKTLGTLSTTTNLNELVGPSGMVAVDPYNIYYNDKPVYWVEPDKFLKASISLNTSESNIEKIGNIKVYNDRDPTCFTTYDDTTLIFDAIPDSVSGLDASKSLAMMYVVPTSRLTQDSDVFDLPDQAFPALNALCLAYALEELKGDTQGGQAKKRNYLRLSSSLSRNVRLVDVATDIRKFVTARQGLSTNNPRIAQ